MLRHKASDVENKLLVLLAVDLLGPLTGLQLLQFLAENDLMDYITLQLALGELTQAGHVEQRFHALGPLYALTPAGKESLSLFLSRIPFSRRTLIRDSAPAWRARFRQEKQVLADFSRREDGEYDLRLRLMEKDAPLLDLTLTLPGRDQADRFYRRWPMVAPDFFGFLMGELGGGPTAESGAELPADTVLTRDGPGVWLLRLNRQTLTLCLSLPSEAMARAFAQRWEQRASGILAFLTDCLAHQA